MLPTDTPEASPLALIVAIAGVDEFQFTWLVMFCVLLVGIRASRCKLLCGSSRDGGISWRYCY